MDKNSEAPDVRRNAEVAAEALGCGPAQRERCRILVNVQAVAVQRPREPEISNL
jgi:hypothetical protein